MIQKRREPYRTLVEKAPLAANERRLWIAVLEAAYADEKAVHWFADNVVAVGSFIWICETLDLDPEVWRRPANPDAKVRHRPTG